MSQPLSEKLKQDLRRLHLTDMAQALDSVLKEAECEKEGYLVFLEKLLSKQIKARAERGLKRRIKKAHFPRSMSFETFDWNFQPSLNVEYVKDLAQLGFVANAQPLLILGKSGCGNYRKFLFMESNVINLLKNQDPYLFFFS